MPDITSILEWLALIGYALVLFTLFLAVALLRGRQTVANILIAVILAWPLWLTTTQFATKQAWSSSVGGAALIYIGCLIAMSVLAWRIMPDEFNEKTLESISKKIVIALGATVGVLLISVHVLAVGTLIPGGTAIIPLFTPEHLTLWWLLFVYASLYIAL